ncbi:MAG: hypothetical protein VB957_05240 [Pseudomonadales bacterium]
MTKEVSAILLVMAALLIIGMTNSTPPPDEAANLLAYDGQGLKVLETQWTKGNVVALVRHTERCDRSDNLCFDGIDGITSVGVKTAMQLGSNYAQLPKHSTTQYYSPIKRTRQTAQYMFTDSGISKLWLQEGCKDNMLDDIYEHKQDDTNLILITHSSCIDGLRDNQGSRFIDLDLLREETYGISVFLTIGKDERQAKLLGYLHADEWSASYR